MDPQQGAGAGLGISGWTAARFQNNPLTPLIAIVLLLVGLFAALVTPREEEPQINVTMANVLIPFPGASVADVEKLVATPAEQVLSQVAGIEHVYSVSQPGMALVTLQFKVGVPRTEALVRLHDTISANRDWLPAGLGVGEPIVKPKGIDDVPVLAVTLWARDARSAEALERVSASIEHELKRVHGTREVHTIGGPGRAVNVWIDPGRLRASGLAIEPLIGALQSANFALPSGSVVSGGAAIRVETGSFLRSAEDVGDLVVGISAARPVYLRDVARVEYGAIPAQRYVWHMPAAGGVAAQPAAPGSAPSDPALSEPAAGQIFPAVTIAVTKKPGENAIDITRALEARLEELAGSVIPTDIEVTVSRNYGETASDKAAKLIQKLAFATLSVIVLVGVALGRREAVVVGAAVILTLTATLFASWAWGFTLNRVSLFALIFSIGILVDDAIVVVENIHRHRELEPGKSLAAIIPGAVDEVGGPTILATLTVIAALLPMAFVTGLMGPYMSPIPINSSMGMLLSLAIAFVVTPWLALRLLRTSAHGAGGHATSRVSMALGRGAGGILRYFIDPTVAASTAGASVGEGDDGAARKPAGTPARYAWRRRALLGGVAVLLVGAVSLVVIEAVILKMLPFDNKSEFQVIVDMPPGTPAEGTNAALLELAQGLAGLPEVIHVQGYAGTASPINFNGLVRQYDLRSNPEQGDLQVNLIDKHARSEKSHPIAQRILPALRTIAARHGARMKVVEVPPGPPVLSPLVAEIYGPDAKGRAALARRLEAAMREIPGLVALDTSLEAPAPRMRLIVDKAKAQALGVSDAAIARAARAALEGVEATYLRDERSKHAVPVRLSLPESEKGKLDAVLDMPVLGAGGKAIRIGELVRVVNDQRDTPIYHKNLLPLTYVVGDMGLVDGNEIDSPLYGMFALRGKLAEVRLPDTGELGEYFITQPSDPYAQYAIKWDGEWQITYETFRDMGLAYAVGLALIYLLVVAQFKSYLTPLIIMAPIPLTIIGVMPGHALLGAQYTATSMIGMIALAGIIVRNSILLVDFIELETRRGVAFADAVVRSAQVRAQPILLTGLAAMIGAFFILDDPIFNGLAVSLIFGILISTLLTLVVIPVLYFLAYRRTYASGAIAGNSSSTL